MSELVGICADAIVDISFSFDYFNNECKADQSSWGVGFYRPGEEQAPYAAIIKEPISAKYSLFNYFLKYGYIKSDLFISNIRLASVGAKVHLNTHPFELMVDPRPEAYTEKSWIFTHNGTMPQIQNDLTFSASIKSHGNTDSEHLFCYFVDQLRRAYVANGYTLSLPEKIEIIQETATRICRTYPRNLNFIMSDGLRMFAYYSGYELAGGLWYQTATFRQEKIALLDESDGMTVSVSCKETNRKICLISASQLTPVINGGWKPFPLHELLVFERGERIH